MAKDLITVQFYNQEVVKRKTGEVVKRQNGEDMVKGLLVGETDGQFPRKIAFTVFNEGTRAECQNLKINDRVDVSYDVESREWEGRYFTEAKAFAIEVMKTSNKPVTQQEVSEEMPLPSDEEDTGLPF